MSGDGYAVASGVVTVAGWSLALGVTASRAPTTAQERAAVAQWLVDLADDMTRADGLAEHDRVLAEARKG